METPPHTKRRIEKSRAKQKGDMLMDWIKVTPEAMPPDGEPILITIESWMDKHRYVWETQARWHNGFYEVWEDDGLACGWASGRFAGSKVTHWMPWPEPAED